jgi:hypothetical protein
MPDPTAKQIETRAFGNDLRQAAFLAQGGLQGNESRTLQLSGAGCRE